MAKRLKFDPRAIEDLQSIRDYLLKRSVMGAENVRAHIADTLDYLAHFPLIGRSTDHPGVRVLPLRRHPYLIFYAVLADEIVILHVRHASRRPLGADEI